MPPKLIKIPQKDMRDEFLFVIFIRYDLDIFPKYHHEYESVFLNKWIE